VPTAGFRQGFSLRPSIRTPDQLPVISLRMLALIGLLRRARLLAANIIASAAGRAPGTVGRQVGLPNSVPTGDSVQWVFRIRVGR
jgi:hypothetical protein